MFKWHAQATGVPRYFHVRRRLSHMFLHLFGITVSTDVAEVSGFSAGVAEVPGNAYTLLYISTGKRTILVALDATNPTNDNNEFKIRNVVLFDGFKKRDAGPNVSISPSNFGNTPPSVTPKGDDITMYYQFLLGMMGTSDANISKLPITNDYMLKTQIVPPVCPTCPSCSVTHTGVCTSCGGQGGAGTQTQTSDKKESENKDDKDKDGEVVDLLKSTGSGATSLARVDLPAPVAPTSATVCPPSMARVNFGSCKVGAFVSLNAGSTSGSAARNSGPIARARGLGKSNAVSAIKPSEPVPPAKPQPSPSSSE
jgi:hypothetical protein